MRSEIITSAPGSPPSATYRTGSTITGFAHLGARTARLALCACAAAAVSTPSHAADTRQPTQPDRFNSMRVRVADLDLASDAGAARALRRIGQAAATLCWDAGPPQWRMIGYFDCRDDAISTVIARLNAPRVTSLYAQSRPTGVTRVARTNGAAE